MEEERLTRLLRDLPHERALAGFTSRVLRRLDEGEAGPRPVAVRTMERRPAHNGYRWAAVTVTLTAFCLSAVLLQREHAQGAYSPAAPASPPAMDHLMPQVAARATADGSLADTHRAQRLDLPTLASLSPAAAGGRYGSSRARQELRSLREGRGPLDNGLHGMHRSGALPPPVVYLGGDENLDIVLNSGHVRGLIPPAPVEHNPDDNNFLD